MGEVALYCSYPRAAWLYRWCSLRASIAGRELSLGWGSQRVAAPSGGQELTVWVCYPLFGVAGRASRPVTVPLSGVVEVRYTAPAISLLKGSLSFPGEPHVAPGLSAVVVFNWVMIGIGVLLTAGGLIWRALSPP